MGAEKPVVPVGPPALGARGQPGLITAQLMGTAGHESGWMHRQGYQAYNLSFSPTSLVRSVGRVWWGYFLFGGFSGCSGSGWGLIYLFSLRPLPVPFPFF